MNWESSADIFRALVIGADLWLIALLVRLLWLRRGLPDKDSRVSALTSLAFIGYVLLNLSERADHLGKGWSWELAGSLVCVTLGVIGVLRRVKVGVEKPNRNGSQRWSMEDRKDPSDRGA